MRSRVLSPVSPDSALVIGRLPSPVMSTVVCYSRVGRGGYPEQPETYPGVVLAMPSAGDGAYEVTWICRPPLPGSTPHHGATARRRARSARGGHKPFQGGGHRR